MSYDPTSGVPPVPPTLTVPSGDPAALHAAADRLFTIAQQIDETGAATIAPLAAIPGWEGAGRDAAMAEVARVGGLLPGIGDSLRSGATATRELATELAAAQAEVVLAQQIALEVAALAMRAVVPVNDLFNGVIGAARASTARADAARRRAIAQWAMLSPDQARTVRPVVATQTQTATPHLFAQIGSKLLDAALLTTPDIALTGIGGTGSGHVGSTDPARHPGWDGGIRLIGWSPDLHPTKLSLSGKKDFGNDLLDKDGPTKGMHQRKVRQNTPGRWPQDKKGPEGFVGWHDSFEKGKHLTRDRQGAVTHDVFVGVRTDHQVGFGVDRNQATIGAEGRFSSGSINDARATWDPRYGGADVGAGTFVGARANAGVSLGYDWRHQQGRAHVGADGFVGGEVKADAGGNIAGAGGRVGVHGYAGAGAKADADLRLRGGKIKARVELGAAFGLGVGADVSVEIDTAKVRNTVSDGAHGVVHGAERLGGWANPFD